MAKTIGQLTQTTTIAGGDEFVIEQTGQTKRVAASVVRGGLVDADVDAAAAIAYSKLDLDDSIVTGDLTADAVTTAKIDDDAVTAAKIDDDAVTTAKILDANVTTAKIADANVTAAKLDGVAKDGGGADIAVGTAPIFGCRAWVNFDGSTGSTVEGEFRCTIRSAGNVEKVVRSSVGHFTAHFITAMQDVNYCAVAAGNAGSDSFGASRQSYIIRTRLVGSVELNCVDDGGGQNNAVYTGLAIFR